MLKEKIFTILVCFFTVILVISFSIGLPIYFRPFYYWQIDSLNLVEETGKSETEIKAAYDDVLDFLTLPNKKFSTGSFKHSESGMQHFEDCKMLFDLNLYAFIVSLVFVIALNLLKHFGFIKFCKPFRRHYSFVCGIFTLLLFVGVGILISLNFDAAFIVFHKLFFAGKENWLFNPIADEIILALPIEFFLNCAVLIGLSIITICILMIVLNIKVKKDL